MDEMKFTVDQLPDVRRFAADHARRYRLGESAVADLVIAINEIATNAVRHGSPVAELRMWTVDSRMVAEIRDKGAWAPSFLPGSTPPASDAEGGMGLWVARQICSAIYITAGSGGTAVRLEMPVP